MGVLSEGLALLRAFTVIFFSLHAHAVTHTRFFNQPLSNAPVPELESRWAQKGNLSIRGSVDQRVLGDECVTGGSHT